MSPDITKNKGYSLTRGLLAVHIITAFLIFLPHQACASSQQTLKLILDENWVPARDAVIRSGNPVLYKLYEWALYRENLNNLPYDRITSFIKRNPTWPDQDELLATAERNMPQDLSTQETLAWFTTYPPVTGQGIERLFHAGISSGQSVASLVDKAWPKAVMDTKTQSDIINQYTQLISLKAHNARLDYLLKAEHYSLARGLASRLQNGYPQLVEARIALREGKRGGVDLVYNVPKSLQNNAGLLFDRVQLMRKDNNNVTASSLLNSASTLQDITFPEDWWKERNIIVRRLIEDKNYNRAYQISSQHNATEGQAFSEAEWLSGWLALRFLNRPDVAYLHFTRMYTKVETAISKARASYWAGRATDALGKPDEAKTWYYQAGTYSHTYYGQIALSQLKIKPVPRPPVIAGPADHTAITSSDLVQAAVLLHQAGYEGLSAKFISAKIKTIKNDGEYQAFATYLKRIDDMTGSYLVAKQASWKNIFLGDTAYPSLMKWIEDIQIDPALAHAIIRQESQFDTMAESPAGALGLMQLMPATAKEVARKKGWDHQTSWLKSRPEHNILLGSAYLNELLRRFNGSYPMAIAAYNAGPSRVNGWIKAFGDPRSGDINWIDWLELIPISETRNYVQRVTEGVVTYRDHLGMTSK